MEITFVTTNQAKVDSLSRTFEPRGVAIKQVAIELPELQVIDLRQIAEYKAHFAYEQLQIPLVVQDAGFFIDAWNGFPGAFVKFALQTLGLEGMLSLVDGRERGCAFRECLTYYDGVRLCSFDATIAGSLAPEPRGERQSESPTQLWKIFVPNGETKTLAEMSDAERDAWRRTRPKNYGDLFYEWYFGPEGPR